MIRVRQNRPRRPAHVFTRERSALINERHLRHSIHPGYLEFWEPLPNQEAKNSIPAGLETIHLGLARPRASIFIGVSSLLFLLACWSAFAGQVRELPQKEFQAPRILEAPKNSQRLISRSQRLQEKKWKDINKILAFLVERTKELSLATSAQETEFSDQAAQSFGIKDVLEVTVQKANLRLAPSKQSSAVMVVSRGTQLLTLSSRPGWFQVFAPTGESLWVSEEVVQLEKSARD